MDRNPDCASEAGGLSRHGREYISLDGRPFEVENRLFAQSGPPRNKDGGFPRFGCGVINAQKLFLGEWALVVGDVLPVRNPLEWRTFDSGVDPQQPEYGVENALVVVETFAFPVVSIIFVQIMEGSFRGDFVEIPFRNGLYEPVEYFYGIAAEIAVSGRGFLPVCQLEPLAPDSVRNWSGYFVFRPDSGFDFEFPEVSQRALMESCGLVFRHELGFHGAGCGEIAGAEIHGRRGVLQTSVRESDDLPKISMIEIIFSTSTQRHN